MVHNNSFVLSTQDQLLGVPRPNSRFVGIPKSTSRFLGWGATHWHRDYWKGDIVLGLGVDCSSKKVMFETSEDTSLGNVQVGSWMSKDLEPERQRFGS